ncbi:hypothetical protein XarbCFBP8142_15050 [Xanthomonas arboricola]|nr:hypothetical protein XarbCFBP8142_15050 [Xanthomonas arboricola]
MKISINFYREFCDAITQDPSSVIEGRLHQSRIKIGCSKTESNYFDYCSLTNASAANEYTEIGCELEVKSVQKSTLDLKLFDMHRALRKFTLCFDFSTNQRIHTFAPPMRRR